MQTSWLRYDWHTKNWCLRFIWFRDSRMSGNHHCTLCQEPIHHLQEFLPALAQMVKNLPTVQKTWVRSLSQEDPLEKGMATHSSILARGIPWTEEPGGLQSMGYQRVRHDWAPQHSTEGLEADVLFFVVVSEQMLLCLPYCCFVAAAPRTPLLLVSCPGSLASASLPFTIPSRPCGGADVIILCGSGHPCFGLPILTLWLSKPVLFRPACGYFPLLFLSFFFNFTILYWFCHISKWICHRCTCVSHYRPSTPVTKLGVFWDMYRLPCSLSQHPGPSHRHVPTFWPLTVEILLYRGSWLEDAQASVLIPPLGWALALC